MDPRELAPSRDFAIVAIGASAGSLTPLETILRRFTLDSMAFVVVQHLAPGGEQQLAEIVARFTTMHVVVATDGTRLEPNHLYVIPGGVDGAVLHGVLHLMQGAAERPRLPIDFFLRSLAEDQGPRAIGVVLSGAGADGTLGLKAVKAQGGITLVQSPESAEHESMPRSAVEAGVADFVLTPEQVTDELMTFSRRRQAPRTSPPPERLGKIFLLLREAFGHDLSLYKPGTIERRIERRMAVTKVARLEEYIGLLQARPDELAALYRDLLIGVTSFFRDGVPFEQLKSIVFPELLARGDTHIRVWVPGCSSGEEAYSIAIALLEHLGDRAYTYRLQIFATDVDAAAIEYARRGFFPAQIALDVSPERLERFFVQKAGGYQVCRRVRDICVFATQNVTRDPPFSKLGLISCRNLLIYLQPQLQKKVLRIFHYSLLPDGFLLLGSSESVGDSPDLFSLIERSSKIYRKKNMPSGAAFDVTFGEGAFRGTDRRTRAIPETRPMANIQQLADRKILERFGPPGVVVNESFEVLQFRGKTGPYLEPLPGAATLHLLKLARPDLVADIRSAVHRALDSGEPVVVRGIALRNGEELHLVDLEAVPLIEPETRARCVLVLFRDTGETQKAESIESRQTATAADPSLRDVERELAATKEYLQTTIEELETSNEELKSANEELQSANEELQSTNEELETSKEELQSTNEELTTVNDELHTRMSDLSQSNDDLMNLLAAIEMPVVIVGIDMRIRRFTRPAETLLNLIPGDIGRPVAHLSWFFPGGLLERHIGSVITNLEPETEEIVASNQRRYRLHFNAYKTVDHVIKGAMITIRELGSAPPEEASVSAEEKSDGHA